MLTTARNGRGDGKRPLGRPMHRSEDNIKVDLKGERESMELTLLVQDVECCGVLLRLQ